MIHVPAIGETPDWYKAIGFKEEGRYEADGVVNFGIVSFGKAFVMFNLHGKSGDHEVSLWFYSDQVDKLYRYFRSLEKIVFVQDIHNPFYGSREFGIRDLNGYILFFRQDA
jgi:hypothetical protein